MAKKSPTIKPEPSIIARNVQRIMIEREMNPKQLAGYAGLGDSYVYNLIDGKSKNPLAANIQKIAAALGCPVVDLLDPLEGRGGDRQHNESIDPSGVIPLFPDEYTLIRLWRDHLPKDGKDAVLVYIAKLIADRGGDAGR